MGLLKFFTFVLSKGVNYVQAISVLKQSKSSPFPNLWVAKKDSDFSAFLLCAVGSDGAMAHGDPIVHVSSSLEGQFW